MSRQWLQTVVADMSALIDEHQAYTARRVEMTVTAVNEKHEYTIGKGNLKEQ